MDDKLTTVRLMRRIQDLEAENAKLRQEMQGMICVCTVCKKIKDARDGSWEYFESYFEQRSALQFSHGICMDCAAIFYSDAKWFTKLG